MNDMPKNVKRALEDIIEWCLEAPAEPSIGDEDWFEKSKDNAAARARQICSALLDASNADGHGGCRYCQS